MHDIFASDFRLFALNISNTDYIVVDGYAVIIHGYYRTTQDPDIWVRNEPENYLKLRKAFTIFGMPMFDITEENFLAEKFDVFSIGRSPL